MSDRRRSLFILLLVFGLMAVSAVVVATKETKLGLDLQGGVQLVYEGKPTPQQPTVDQQGRVIGCGRGSRELTGLSDEKVIGRPVQDVLGLHFPGGEDHVGVVLEWGVRQLGKDVTVHAEGDLPAKAVADLFPAYDDDGGLLLVLTPSK